MFKKIYTLFLIMFGTCAISNNLMANQFHWNAKSFSKLVKLAESGDVESQSTLGQLYLTGEYVNQDIEKAKYWLDKAYLKNDLNATVNLSYLHANYLGNIDKAIELLKPLANKGDKDAIYNLAFLYEKTDSVEEAMHWYRVLSELGDADAQFNLALLMGKQESVNPREVISLLEDSLKKKDDDTAKFLLSTFYLDYEEVRDIEKGMKLLIHTAEKGLGMAEHKLGKIYEEGTLVPKDLKESKKWLSRSRLHGHVE